MTNKLTITDAVTANDEAEFLVCLPAEQSCGSLGRTNVIGVCCRCGRSVQHRPNAPPKPKRICTPCALPNIETEIARGEYEMVTTPEQLAEVAEVLKRETN